MYIFQGGGGGVKIPLHRLLPKIDFYRETSSIFKEIEHWIGRGDGPSFFGEIFPMGKDFVQTTKVMFIAMLPQVTSSYPLLF